MSGLAQGSAIPGRTKPHTEKEPEGKTRNPGATPHIHPKGFLLLRGTLGRSAALLGLLQIWLAFGCLVGPASFGNRRGRASRCPKAKEGIPVASCCVLRRLASSAVAFFRSQYCALGFGEGVLVDPESLQNRFYSMIRLFSTLCEHLGLIFLGGFVTSACASWMDCCKSCIFVRRALRFALAASMSSCNLSFR